ncbi:hypothetical protein VPH35_082923 [Triticum aestivum]
MSEKSIVGGSGYTCLHIITSLIFRHSLYPPSTLSPGSPSPAKGTPSPHLLRSPMPGPASTPRPLPATSRSGSGRWPARPLPPRSSCSTLPTGSSYGGHAVHPRRDPHHRTDRRRASAVPAHAQGGAPRVQRAAEHAFTKCLSDLVSMVMQEVHLELTFSMGEIMTVYSCGPGQQAVALVGGVGGNDGSS